MDWRQRLDPVPPIHLPLAFALGDALIGQPLDSLNLLVFVGLIALLRARCLAAVDSQTG